MKNKLLIPLGNVGESDYFCELEKVHHLLVSGCSGSGKSIFLHQAFRNLMTKYTGKDVQIVLIDSKHTEFYTYEGNSRIVGGKPIYEPKEVEKFLAELLDEMNKRFQLFNEASCLNFERYNESHEDNRLARIVVIIDEYADVVYETKKASTKHIEELTCKGHGAGIHFIIATQCPRQDVISPIIKANMIGRIAFKVADAQDSRFILDKKGAENLAGRGEFLYADLNTIEPIKGQVPYDKEAYQFISGKWKEFI